MKLGSVMSCTSFDLAVPILLEGARTVQLRKGEKACEETPKHFQFSRIFLSLLGGSSPSAHIKKIRTLV